MPTEHEQSKASPKGYMFDARTNSRPPHRLDAVALALSPSLGHRATTNFASRDWPNTRISAAAPAGISCTASDASARLLQRLCTSPVASVILHRSSLLTEKHFAGSDLGERGTGPPYTNSWALTRGICFVQYGLFTLARSGSVIFGLLGRDR